MILRLFRDFVGLKRKRSKSIFFSESTILHLGQNTENENVSFLFVSYKYIGNQTCNNYSRYDNFTIRIPIGALFLHLTKASATSIEILIFPPYFYEQFCFKFMCTCVYHEGFGV